MTIEEGKMVSLEYTLKDEKGNLIESNEGKDPLVYNHGSGQIIPGLEKELGGLKTGDTKNVVVTPLEGYGEINDEAFIEVANEKIPEEARKVGTQLQTQGPDGQVLQPIVSEVKDACVVLDFNHPLAGKTLHFDVKVLEIKEAAAG